MFRGHVFGIGGAKPLYGWRISTHGGQQIVAAKEWTPDPRRAWEELQRAAYRLHALVRGDGE